MKKLDHDETMFILHVLSGNNSSHDIEYSINDALDVCIKIKHRKGYDCDTSPTLDSQDEPEDKDCQMALHYFESGLKGKYEYMKNTQLLKS